MRALLTPEIAPRLGIVLFRPGADLMPLFRQGRLLIQPQPVEMQGLPAGLIPSPEQPLHSDPAVLEFLSHHDVVNAAGGINALEYWLMHSGNSCQNPDSIYHHHELTSMRIAGSALRLCWGCDTALRKYAGPDNEAMATSNAVQFVTERILSDLALGEGHKLTLPELCWWAVRRGVTHVIPEPAAEKSLRITPEKIPAGGVYRESEITPKIPAQKLLDDAVTPVKLLAVDTETPESFMLRPKRRRWENQKYTAWVKTQPCMCCNKPADDPHHLIGHGQGGMGTKAHDLFVMPLCRTHHDELHADPVEFEAKYGSQLDLLFRFIDRTLATGVLA